MGERASRIRWAAAVALCLALVGAAPEVGAGASVTSAAERDVTEAAATPAPRASAGCDATEATPGAETRTISSRGVERTYIRHVPPAHADGAPVPLVVAIHGLAEGAVLHQQMTEFPALAAEEGFALAFPQGLGNPAQWNAAFSSNDIALVGDLLDELEADLCLDLDRIYVSGFSMGAFMASSVACVYADRVAAVAPVAGLRNPTGCAPVRPVPVITFHGTADTWVGYGPTPANAAAWAARNGCDGAPAEEFVGADDVVEITLLRHPCGPGAAPVELYRIDEGGHAWPGSEFSRAIAAAVGHTTFEIDASTLIWSFFQQHPLPTTEVPAADRIAGTVVGPDGEPAAGVWVLAYLPSDGWIGTVAATTDDRGAFALVDLPPGDHRLQLIPPAGSGLRRSWFGGPTRAAAEVIRIDGTAPVPELVIELAAGARVTGSVVGPTGVPVPEAAVWLYAPTDGWVGTATATTGADGAFAVEHLPPGTYRVRVTPPPGAGLAVTWFGGATRAQATPVVVDAGVDGEPVAVVVGPAPGP